MSAHLVRFRFKRKVACAMSEYMELINPKTKICKLIKDGEVVLEYKMEQCDKCSLLAKLDEFGYTRGLGGEKLLWFCGSCR